MKTNTIADLEKEVARLQDLVDAWGIEGGPPIRITNVVTPSRAVRPGAEIHCAWTADKDVPGCEMVAFPDGSKFARVKATIPANVTSIDTVSIFSFSDALGFSHAVCGVFGSSKQLKEENHAVQ